jgi:MoaA/NifB/PqqE/SkfB family radical SAM enzyme
MTYTRVDLTQYVVISICFSCNNDCSICMLSGLKRKFPAIGFDRFKKVIIDIVNSGRFENLILSGAEVTTFNDLDKYVQFAASLGWFKKIQIQTNGRRLSEKGYLRHLIDCGVNEFFISIHGLDDVHDAVTRTSGSFDELAAGLKNLEAYDVNVISNTVLTKTNLHDMARLMTFLSNERISEIQLWNFFPMERTDTRDLVVSMKDFTEVLPEILSIVKRAGKPLVLKSFPECLSMGEPGFFDSLFPVTVLPDVFWRKFSESGFGTCIYRQREECKAWKCWGLSSAYVQKYGDERNLLKPMM